MPVVVYLDSLILSSSPSYFPNLSSHQPYIFLIIYFAMNNKYDSQEREDREGASILSIFAFSGAP